jgi:hypothetical protein
MMMIVSVLLTLPDSVGVRVDISVDHLYLELDVESCSSSASPACVGDV